MTEEDKRVMSVSMFEGDNMVMEHREIRLDPLNEKFFMYLFKALMFTKSSSILYQLLDVINFYIKYETEFQKEIINAQTILWMLQIIEQQNRDKDLCLIAAKTVLLAVNHHKIVFDTQEMAIIEKFNKALENFGGDPRPGQEVLLSSNDEDLVAESKSLELNSR